MAADGAFRTVNGAGRMGQLPALLGLLRLLVCTTLLPAPQGPASPEDFSEKERGPNRVPPLSQFGRWGWEEGQFLEPRAVAVTSDDRILVADTGNHRVQVFLSDGKRIAGWGARGNKPGEFLFPSGIAAGPRGEILVADTGNDRIQVFDASGTFLRLWTRKEAVARPMRKPWRIAVGADRLALVEQDDPRVELLSLDGESRVLIGGFGDGPAQFKDPSGLAFDASGNLYVADPGTCRILKFDPEGKPLLQWGAWGNQAGLFSSPRGVACGPGRVYVADADNHRIQAFDPSGRFLFQWGRAPTVSQKGEGRLHFPSALAVSPSGGLTVTAEPVEHRCQVFANGSLRKVFPAPELPWWEDLHARSHPVGRPVPAGSTPSVWGRNPPVVVPVLEADAHAVLFYDLGSPGGTVIARGGGFGRKLGEFIEPGGLAHDAAAGRTYVADRGNRRVQVLALERSETSLTGFEPGVKVIAAFEPARRVPAGALPDYRPELGVPEALALDPDGNLLVADGPNAAVLSFTPKLDFVRAVKIPAAGAPVRPAGLAVSTDGKVLFVTNPLGAQVLALDRQGKLLAAWGSPAAEGKTSFLHPSGIAVDDAGAVYVSDSYQDTLKKFDEKGTPLAAWGGFGSVPGRYQHPLGLIFLKPARIVVDDVANHRIQTVSPDGRGRETLIKGGSTPPPVPSPK